MDICPCCKKPAEELIPRYVGIKKSVLNICRDCIEHMVTYEPSMHIPDGDATICG